MTCPKSRPIEKKEFEHSLVRCNVTGYACGIGFDRDKPCEDPWESARKLL